MPMYTGGSPNHDVYCSGTVKWNCTENGQLSINIIFWGRVQSTLTKMGGGYEIVDFYIIFYFVALFRKVGIPI